MERVIAAIVAIKSSGQMMVVMMEAGKTMPPIPRPARMRMIHSVDRLSRVATERAPQPFWLLLKRRIHGDRMELTSGHQNRTSDHECSIMASED